MNTNEKKIRKIGKAVNLAVHKIVRKTGYHNNHIWVFGEWFGKRCCDNSLYLANYIAENYPAIQCAWVSEENADVSALAPSIMKLKKNTPETDKILQNAEVLIMNQGIVDVSDSEGLVFSGPVSVNLWHGVPWKKIGLDGIEVKSVIKRIYYRLQTKLRAADYYLASSEDFARILVSSCGAVDKRVIRAGYPRNQLFYDPETLEQKKRDLLSFLTAKTGKVFQDDTKIITYMPTFRDKKDREFSFASIQNDSRLTRILSENNAVIIEKSHFAESHNADGIQSDRVLIMNDYAAQELLAATDILITDYSSCFFDFLILDRPIIHFLYDYEYYATKDRGLYYKKEEVVCGDSPENTSELLDSIEENLNKPEKDSILRQKRRNQYVTYENEDSCKVITERIINSIKKR